MTLRLNVFCIHYDIDSADKNFTIIQIQGLLIYEFGEWLQSEQQQ